jgi:hypothetical protein
MTTLIVGDFLALSYAALYLDLLNIQSWLERENFRNHRFYPIGSKLSYQRLTTQNLS